MVGAHLSSTSLPASLRKQVLQLQRSPRRLLPHSRCKSHKQVTSTSTADDDTEKYETARDFQKRETSRNKGDDHLFAILTTAFVRKPELASRRRGQAKWRQSARGWRKSKCATSDPGTTVHKASRGSPPRFSRAHAAIVSEREGRLSLTFSTKDRVYITCICLEDEMLELHSHACAKTQVWNYSFKAPGHHSAHGVRPSPVSSSSPDEGHR